MGSHNHPFAQLLEKESATALHGSGRNSGVLHAGFYYSSDSCTFTSSVRAKLEAFTLTLFVGVFLCMSSEGQVVP